MPKARANNRPRLTDERVKLRVLLMNKRMCCVCHSPDKPVQLHHIDGNRSHTTESNLAVLFPDRLRNSLCAPQDKYSRTAIWQEQTFSQDIERTLRLLLRLKERDGSPDPASGRATPRRRARRGGWRRR